MPVTVVEPPEPIVSLDEVKKHVRFSPADDDAYLEALVAAVTGYLDGPPGRLGRAIGPQTLEEDRQHFPGHAWGVWDGLPHWCRHESLFIVQCPPIVSLTSIAYIDETGAPQTIDPATLTFDSRRIQTAFDTCWPLVRHQLGAVKVTYQAGYEVIPPAIKQAVLLMVGTLYANREASIDTAFCGAAESLLSPYARVV